MTLLFRGVGFGDELKDEFTHAGAHRDAVLPAVRLERRVEFQRHKHRPSAETVAVSVLLYGLCARLLLAAFFPVLLETFLPLRFKQRVAVDDADLVGLELLSNALGVVSYGGDLLGHLGARLDLVRIESRVESGLDANPVGFGRTGNDGLTH